jgi:hypothetical protein
MPMRLMGSKPILRVDLGCKRRLPITFNYDRVLLKLWNLPACVIATSSLRSISEKLGVGKDDK